MKSGYCIIAAWLIAVQAVLAQPRSKLQASIPPAKLAELVSSRQRAQEELRPSGVDDLSPQILRWFVEPGASVAIVKMEQVIAEGDHYGVTLVVEKVLRGVPPAKLSVEIYWSERSSLWSKGGERIRPSTGKTALVALIAVDSDMWNKRTLFVGILDLENTTDAAFLPSASAAAKMDADAAVHGATIYEAGLKSENPVVHELALQRLLGDKYCTAESHCEESILFEIRRLLTSPDPRLRMRAVGWLGSLSEKIESCQLSLCVSPKFHREPVRRLLKNTVQDKNVAVGDLAFQYLATMEFKDKRNAGYCEEIVPAMRTVERYPFDGGEHWLGGPLNDASTCVRPPQE